MVYRVVEVVPRVLEVVRREVGQAVRQVPSLVVDRVICMLFQVDQGLRL